MQEQPLFQLYMSSELAKTELMVSKENSDVALSPRLQAYNAIIGRHDLPSGMSAV